VLVLWKDRRLPDSSDEFSGDVAECKRVSKATEW
jgi:hypothetical protein